jgi:phosphoserine phosphatase
LGRYGGGGGGGGSSGSESEGEKGWDVAVVSVNWSGAFIKGVVEAASGNGGIRRVVANGIGFPDGMIEGPPELGKEPLCTAGDKLRAMDSVKSGLDKQKVVYFGDSATDLACLVAADLGVIMADDGETKLLKILARIGFEVPHVQEAREGDKLVWGRDFEEVLQSGVMERI